MIIGYTYTHVAYTSFDWKSVSFGKFVRTGNQPRMIYAIRYIVIILALHRRMPMPIASDDRARED